MLTHTRNNRKLLVLFLANIFSTQNILCAIQLDEENTTLIEELPNKTELNEYITSLEKVIEFCSRFKNHLEMNLEFGLFLINVNLKQVVRLKRKTIEDETYQRIAKMIHTNDHLIRYFHMMMRLKPVHSMYKHIERITTLFSNETLWALKIPKLNAEVLWNTQRRAKNELEGVFANSNTYRERVYNFSAGIPSPKLSDQCMAHLAENPASENKPPLQCKVPTFCKQMLKESTDLGYFISHRLLFFISAHMGRGCVMFTEQEDNSIMRELCTTMSDEAEYIAMDNYSIKDLLLEDVALCTISGHAQFLQRQWLSHILRFQTKLGCFSDDINHQNIYPGSVKRDTTEWSLFRENNDIMEGYCNTHFTGVAAASISGAIRYILEYYY